MRNQGLVLAAVLAMGLMACGDDEAARDANRDRNDSTEEAEADEADAGPGEAEAGADAGTDAFAEEDEAATGAGPGALIDADALALLAVFDEHVVEAAKLVNARGAKPAVKTLATTLASTHTTQLGAIRKLERTSGPIAAHKELEALKASLASQRTTISDSVDGPPLDVAYLESMVASHTEALALIDGQLLPGARIEPVRAHIDTARTAIAADLEKAQKALSDY